MRPIVDWTGENPPKRAARCGGRLEARSSPPSPCFRCSNLDGVQSYLCPLSEALTSPNSCRLEWSRPLLWVVSNQQGLEGRKPDAVVRRTQLSTRYWWIRNTQKVFKGKFHPDESGNKFVWHVGQADDTISVWRWPPLFLKPLCVNCGEFLCQWLLSQAFPMWTGRPGEESNKFPSANTHISTRPFYFLFHGHFLIKAPPPPLNIIKLSLHVLLWCRSRDLLHKLTVAAEKTSGATWRSHLPPTFIRIRYLFVLGGAGLTDDTEALTRKTDKGG